MHLTQDMTLNLNLMPTQLSDLLRLYINIFKMTQDKTLNLMPTQVSELLGQTGTLTDADRRILILMQTQRTPQTDCSAGTGAAARLN